MQQLIGSRRLSPGEWWARAVDIDDRRPWVLDVAVTVAFGALTTAWLFGHPRHAADWACQVALVVPLGWRRTRPTAAFVALAAVALVQWLIAGPLLSDSALLIGIFTLASDRPRREWLGALCVVEVGVVLASTRWGFTGSWIRSLVGLSGLAVATVLAGLVFRARRAHVLEVAERAERLQIERDHQAQLAAGAERTRIAREMHDVVAHSLAVMIALADGAAAKLARDPAASGRAIAQVADTGRQALGETRRILGVLRDPSSTMGFSPQPGLADLEALLVTVRATGLHATLSVTGEPFSMSPGMALTVFRVVQEASTNSLKHSVDATEVAVTLRYDWPHLHLRVVDDGRPVSLPPAGDGQGLPGMRERVALFDGAFEAGPGPRGFAVQATLCAPSASSARRPVDPARAVDDHASRALQ